MAGKVQDTAGKNVVAVISGGNVDVNVIAQVIETGLLDSGRRVRLVIGDLPDRPGALATCIDILARSAANIVDIEHKRSSGTHSRVKVTLVLDVRDFDHADALIAEMNAAGYKDVIKIYE
jgi:threonine dehydratase